jgi:hypothetical protein
MDILRREDLEALAQPVSGPALSLYMPTHVRGVDTLQDPIRFKNLLKHGEKELEQYGMRSAEARELLQPAYDLLENHTFWQHQGRGLAIFLAKGMVRQYHIPIDLDELVVVGERFHLKPLLRMLTGDGLFYVLALSGDEVRLVDCSRYTWRRVPLPNSVPRSFEEAQRFTVDDEQRQLHTRTSVHGQSGKRPGIFFGNGPESEDDKARILEYFQTVDRGLREIFHEKRRPLVFAGVEYLLPIYREATAYPNVMGEIVHGNPEGSSDAELHERAWPIVEPAFHKQQEQAADQFKTLQPVGRASHTIKEVVAAAYQGRVDTLFIATGLQHWGIFDPATFAVESHKVARPGDEDLLDFAALQTLLKGGKVFAVEPSEIPDGAPLAAVYRY